MCAPNGEENGKKITRSKKNTSYVQNQKDLWRVQCRGDHIKNYHINFHTLGRASEVTRGADQFTPGLGTTGNDFK